jgi:ADP-ribose pyrophosphatase YjhB (NUDIX family)
MQELLRDLREECGVRVVLIDDERLLLVGEQVRRERLGLRLGFVGLGLRDHERLRLGWSRCPPGAGRGERIGDVRLDHLQQTAIDLHQGFAPFVIQSRNSL